MNSIEEILWRYIDGICTPEEQQVIQALIAEDESYRLKYQELTALNAGLAEMELDEPPMAFTYNVMENIRAEHALVPLKAAINQKIIRGIAIFFSVTLLAILAFVVFGIKWNTGEAPVNLSLHIKMPQIDLSKAKWAVQVFVFFDVVLGLYLFDAFLRKRSAAKNG
jgi:hypothetical protein